MGRTEGKIGRLVQRVNYIGLLNERKFSRQIEINKGVEEVLTDILARLTITEELQGLLQSDIEELKQSNFDYQIKLLSKNLEDAQAIIDRLQNTAWRRFLRWIRLLFTV